MPIQSELVTVCNNVGATILGVTHKGEAVPGGRLMLTIAGLESNFGLLREFVRSEKSYSPGGYYFKINSDIRTQYRRYGVLATASYGTFQIMLATARELGFNGHPIELQDDIVCGFWAGQLITKRILGRQKAKTLRDVFDAYNSGNHADRFIPQDYIAKGMKIYDDLKGT